jgi:hypothetical protein
MTQIYAYGIQSSQQETSTTATSGTYHKSQLQFSKSNPGLEGKNLTSYDITGSWVLFEEGCTYVITQKMSSKFPKT